MKTSCLTLAVLFSTLGAYGEVATSTPYAVVQRDANSRVWERTTYAVSPSGKVVPTKHHYTELATGLCYSQNGQYVDSVEQINLVGNGAEAVQGPCKVQWTPDASAAGGAVRLTTPGGQHFTSRVFGLALRDTSSGSSVLIAQITNSTGVLVGRNQILYPSAFSGLQADIQDIYRKSGFEQNVVLREQPPSPADYGLNPETTRLEVLTEFFNPPTPKKTTVKTDGESDDVKLNFGDLHIRQGTAFLTPGQDNPSSKKVKVAKHWEKLDNGRVFLIEEVPLQGMTNLLRTLPPHASTGKTRGKVRRTASLKSLLQAGNAIQKSSGAIKVAQAMSRQPGVVIDYTTIIDGVTSYDFLGDTTYYVSGYFWINDPAGMGSVSFEGGTVIKFTNSSDANIEDASTTDGNFNGSSYQPVIFTSSDDDSVGERIAGSSGSPSEGTAYYYAEDGIYLTNVTVANVRFCYAAAAYEDVNDSGFFFNDCQFVKCGICTYFLMPDMYISFKNVLATKCEHFFWMDSSSYAGSLVLDAENITLNSCNQFYSDPSIPYNVVPSGGITNSILTPCDGSATCCFYLDHTTTGSTNGVYQPSGAGSSYLTNGSTNWNAGTTNIDPALLADLRTKTTHAPISLTGLLTTNCVISPQAQLDTNSSTVDRGYHYDPLDCVIYNLQVSNATMTVLPGTMLVIAGSKYGISTLNGANLQFLGAPAQPININMIHYNSVQEGFNTNLFSTNLVEVLLVTNTSPPLNFRFVNWWPLPASNPFYIFPASPTTNALSLFGCQFYGGGFFMGGANGLVTNCLFQGISFDLEDGSYSNSLAFYNNLFLDGVLDLYHGRSGTWTFSDNLFDHAAISEPDNPMNVAQYNGFVTNCNRLSPTNAHDVILTSSPAYQTGMLGVYYYPTNLTNLIHKGSRSASAAGLYHYTVTTDNVADGTNTVSIGYHYLGNDPSDFWLALFNFDYDLNNLNDYTNNALALYISSPVGATGTVSIPGVIFNSNKVVVTGCGDASVNGTYVLGNMTAQEQEDWVAAGLQPMAVGYVKGTNWINYYMYSDGNSGFTRSVLLSYDSNARKFTILYYLPGLNLNGSSTDWQNFYDPAVPPPTTVCKQDPYSQSFSVAPGEVANIFIPNNAMITNYDVIGTNGIHITASQQVSVCAFNYNSAASTAFTAYPTPLLGTNYCLMSYAPYWSQFAIVATTNNTTVTITPSATADLLNHGTNVYILTNLQQGETYQINTSNETDDVTGTFVTSDKPIGVFAGTAIVDMPNASYSAANPIVQEQLPVNSWGTNVLALSFAGRLSGDTYRVLAVTNGTVITISGNVITNDGGSPPVFTTNYEVVVVTKQAGQFYDTMMDGPVVFQGSHPIQVAQFGNSWSYDAQTLSSSYNIADPCEILLQPTNDFLTSYTVIVPENTYYEYDFLFNYLTIIVPQSATNTTFVDDSPVTDLPEAVFTTIGSSSYTGIQIQVTNGVHTVSSSLPAEVQVYGWGNWDAYGYFGGIPNGGF